MCYLFTLGYNFLLLKDKLVRQGNDAHGFHDNTAQKSPTCCITMKHFENHFLATPQTPRGTDLHLPFTLTSENYTHGDRERVTQLPQTFTFQFSIVHQCMEQNNSQLCLQGDMCSYVDACNTLHLPRSYGYRNPYLNSTLTNWIWRQVTA